MTYSSVILADTPHLWWRLGEASGTTAEDSSGNNRDGTYAGSPALAASGLLTGDADTCVNLDGTNDVISIEPTPFGANESSDFSAEAWFDADTVSGNRLIIGRVSASSGLSRSNVAKWMFRIDGGTLNFWRNTNGTSGWVQLNCGSVSAATRYHVVVTCDRTTSVIKVYLNGSQVATVTATGSLPYTGNTSDGAGFNVGNWMQGGGGSEWFDGKIDEAAYYEYVLSAGQVLAHYNEGLSPTASPPNAPINLATDPDVTEIDFTWDPAGSGGTPDGYEVRINGGTAADVGALETHTFTGLTPATSYTLEARAYNGSGDSSWSSTSASTDPVPAPTGLAIFAATGDSLTLSWDDVTVADGYEVRIDGGTPEDIGDTLAHVFTGLTEETTYTLEVRAYIGGAFSSWSSISGDTTDGSIPFTADLIIGSHAFTVNSWDTLDPEDPIHVLDGLTIGWKVSESKPWPAQPDPVEASVALLTDDVVNLADVELGDPMSAVLTDEDDNVFATFHGRVTQLVAQPLKHGGNLYMRYAVTGDDYVVDLAETPVTRTTPLAAAAAATRFDDIIDAAEAAGTAPIDTPADVDSAAFEELSAGTSTAASLLEDHLAQVAVDVGDGLQRHIVVPVVVDDELDHYETVLLARTVDASLLPGTFDVVDGLLVVVFPDITADGIVDAGLGAGVLLDVPWTKLKFRAVNRVTVTGDTVTAAASRPGPPVGLSLSTTLTDQDAADRMAHLYLPDVDENNGWVADTFRLLAYRNVAAIVPAWFPDHRDDPATTTVYVQPIALVNVADNINLAGGLGVYAGQLVAVKLQFSRGRMTVDFSLRRQLPVGTGDDAASWAWAQATFPTLAWEDIDPGLSWYEARLGKAT